MGENSDRTVWDQGVGDGGFSCGEGMPGGGGGVIIPCFFTIVP